jgi:GAF domain-containing protein
MPSVSDLSDFDLNSTHRSLSQIRSNAFETSVFSELRRRVAAFASIPPVVEETARSLRQLTPATVIVLYKYDAESDIVTCDCVAGDSQGLLHGLKIRVGERITGWSAATLQTSVNSHAYLDLGPLSEMFVPTLLSSISIPLLREGRVAGVLTGYSPKRDAFTDEHRYAFEHVSQILSDKLTPGNPKGETGRNVVAFRSSY